MIILHYEMAQKEMRFFLTGGSQTQAPSVQTPLSAQSAAVEQGRRSGRLSVTKTSSVLLTTRGYGARIFFALHIGTKHKGV